MPFLRVHEVLEKVRTIVQGNQGLITLNSKEDIMQLSLYEAIDSEEETPPTRLTAAEILSENYNGSYQIFQNSDGSLSCNCISFLLQKKTRSDGYGFSTCKHIRKYLADNPVKGANGFKPLPPVRRKMLKELGVDPEHLTSVQGYFVFYDLLKKQGVDKEEYEKLLKTHGTVSILPVYPFGVELEINVSSQDQLYWKLNGNGINSILTGYTGSSRDSRWRVSTDRSIRADRGYEAVELVSPKLFGAEGFCHIKKVLEIVHEVGVKVNRSCGFHVHIDAWGWNTDLMLELAKVWAKIEVPFLWYLVSPSRRNNLYCQMVDMSAPGKAYVIQLVEIQPEVRVATTSELNPAPGGVTCHREARGMGYRATTQVKGLSPGITIVSVADAVHGCGRQNSHSRHGEAMRARRGLRP